MSGRLALRNAIHTKTTQTALKHQSVKRAHVTSTNPITVEMFGYGHPLTESNDFNLSQWMKLYHSVCGIKVGDMALMTHSNSWELFDVVSDTDVVGIFNTWRHS